MKRLNTLLRYVVFFLANLFVARASAQIDWPQLKLTQIASGLIAPVHVNSARDGSERLFVVEQEGRIRIVQSNSLIPAPFLDITERVSSPLNSLYGLLSVAFPTNYTAKGYFYVYYSRTNDQASVISRFFVSTNANRADPLTEQVVLVISNAECVTLLGGLVAFGPDGYLYISTGSDELCADQPESQRPDSLWGKILRIDVESGTNAYRVPTNNPFVNNPAYRPEIWALGFRNPWRFSFDRQTGDLYIGDVGQNEWEEINFQSAGSAGGQNYGWPAREGNHPFDDLPEVDPDLLTPPIVEYPHTNLAPSAVTAGFVYRGPNSPRMNGLYFFGDFYRNQVWAVAHSGVNWQMQTIPIPKQFISSFGEDESGQFYFADLLFGTVNRVEDSGLTGAPIFTPSVSNSPSDVISVRSISPGAIIHFTTNGLTPLETDPAVSSGGTISITSGMTLSARAFRADLLPSTTTAVTFTLQTGLPVFSPPRGPITNGTLLTMISGTPGATIRYTLDGTDPNPSSPIYTVPVVINAGNRVAAQTYKTGFSNSAIQRVFYGGSLMLGPIEESGGVYHFTWLSETNSNYLVEFSSDLENWRQTPYPTFGTGTALFFYFSPTASKQFFRVRIF